MNMNQAIISGVQTSLNGPISQNNLFEFHHPLLPFPYHYTFYKPADTMDRYTPRSERRGATNDVQPSSYSSSSYGSQRSGRSTATSSSGTAMSFQERMAQRDREKQQKEREEREAALRALREPSIPKPTPQTSTPTSSTAATASTAPAATSTGTGLWNRFLAAKEVVNAAITGEERWPESDESDHEGESHIGRLIREHQDKLDEAEVAAKIAAIDMDATARQTSSSSSSSTERSQRSGRTTTTTTTPARADDYTSSRDRDRDGSRRKPSTTSSNSSGGGGGDREDYYGRSLRERNKVQNHNHDLPPSEAAAAQSSWDRSWSQAPPNLNNASISSSSSSGTSSLLGTNAGMGPNRYRKASDASRNDALSRLEGKNSGAQLAAQVSHLGSTSPRTRHQGPTINGGGGGGSNGYHDQNNLAASLSAMSSNNSSSSSSSRYDQGNGYTSRQQQQQPVIPARTRTDYETSSRSRQQQQQPYQSSRGQQQQNYF